MMVKFAEDILKDAMRGAASVMGDSGFCYLVSHDDETIGSGTWKFVPDSGFTVDCPVNRGSHMAHLVIRGKAGDWIRHAVGPVSSGDVVRFTSGLSVA